LAQEAGGVHIVFYGYKQGQPLNTRQAMVRGKHNESWDESREGMQRKRKEAMVYGETARPRSHLLKERLIMPI
jgi:hypothetical protein